MPEEVELPPDGDGLEYRKADNGQVAIAKAGTFDEIGAAGLSQMGGRVYEEFLPNLQGDKARKVWQEMGDNDAVIGGIFFAIDMLMRQVEWNGSPHEEDPDGDESVAFLEGCLDDLSINWEDTLSTVLSFLQHGWSYFEILYKLRQGPDQKDPRRRSQYTDGMVGWRKFAFRAQETRVRWEFDETGGIQALIQLIPSTFEEKPIPMIKSLLFRTTAAKGNPEGKSILRTAYRSWHMKKRIEEYEAIGIERDLAGLPIAYVPHRLFSPNASIEEKTALEAIKKMVRNIRVDEAMGIVMPQIFDENRNPLYKLELLSTSGSRKSFDTDKVIGRYDQRMAMTALADFILLGHENVGSFALGGSKIELFATALGAWLDMVAGVFNDYAIPRLWKLNGKDIRTKPELVHSDVSQVDYGVLLDALKKLSDTGAPIWTGDEEIDLPLLNLLLKMGGLPEREALGPAPEPPKVVVEQPGETSPDEGEPAPPADPAAAAGAVA